MIRAGICLFVYGTLMSAATSSLGQRERKRLHREARCLGPATVRGQLYHVGPCPALTDGDDSAGSVHGEAFLLTRPKATFGWLDRFEAPDYARVERSILLASGDCRNAWVYVYVGATGQARAIASGRWRRQAGAPRPPVNGGKARSTKQSWGRRKGAGLSVRARPRPRFDLPR